MKGIILAGGNSTRLKPSTVSICKALLPVWDKPLIYYPLSTLILVGIKDILIISRPEDKPKFKDLLGDGSKLGVNFYYDVQEKPRGIADSFIIGERFIGRDNCCLILGDNIFYGHGLTKMLRESSKRMKGATVFGYHVDSPEKYGVVEFDKNNKVLSIKEKPEKPKSNYILTGLYFYDNKVVDIAKKIKPSKRGELEITDINKEYLKLGELEVKLMGRGFVWIDTGTMDSMYNASDYIRITEKITGLKIGCLEEIAYNLGYINKDELIKLAEPLMSSGYGDYLLKVIDQPQIYTLNNN